MRSAYTLLLKTPNNTCLKTLTKSFILVFLVDELKTSLGQRMSKKKLKYILFIGFPLCLILILFLGREELLSTWYTYQLKQLEGQEQIDYALELEEKGELSRRIITSWYIEQLNNWKIDPEVKKKRDRKEATIPHKEVVVIENQKRQLTAFYYPDEKSPAHWSSRLIALEADCPPELILKLLEDSEPILPLSKYGLTMSLGRVNPPSTMLSLHYTSYHLIKLKEKSVPGLVELLPHESKNLRFQALYALKHMTVTHKEDKIAVLKLLADPDRNIRNAAHGFLLRHDPNGELAMPTLEEGIKKELKVSRDCGLNLLKLLGKNEKADRVLGKALLSSDFTAKQIVLQYLGSQGKAVGAVPKTEQALIKTLKEEPKDLLRTFSTYAIRKLSLTSPEVIQALCHALETDKDRSVRHGVVLALRDLAPDSKPAVPSLRKALNDEYELVRRFAKYALVALGESVDS